MSLLYELFGVFFKVGLFSFGGGYTILSVIQHELTSRDWLSIAEYSQVVTISQMTPGPIAVNAATYVGAKLFSQSFLQAALGSAVATLAVSLPSFVIVLIVARFLKQFKQSQTIKYIMDGIRPSVIGFMVVAVILFGRLAFLKVYETGFRSGNINPIGIAIFVIAAYLHGKKGLSPIKTITLCGALGLILL